jgi:hypothetical protein
MIIIYLLTFFIAFGIAFLLTPLIRILSVKMGWLDKPNFRKVNQKPMPLLGGPGDFRSLYGRTLYHPGLKTGFYLRPEILRAGGQRLNNRPGWNGR